MKEPIIGTHAGTYIPEGSTSADNYTIIGTMIEDKDIPIESGITLTPAEYKTFKEWEGRNDFWLFKHNDGELRIKQPSEGWTSATYFRLRLVDGVIIDVTEQMRKLKD